ncbi:MAG: lysophospholipase [Eubacteriales bacterium]
MSDHEFEFQAYDGVHISYYKWEHEPGQTLQGIILILHGMAEHALRYKNFAQFLNVSGFTVFACDHRGHGKTGIATGTLGDFEAGWQAVVNDIHQLVGIVKKENKDLPIIVLGHSMGSLLARSCIMQFGNEFQGVILSGTTNSVNAISRIMGLRLSQMTALIYGSNKKSKFLQGLFFGNYNKTFSNDHGGYDWLSRDRKIVQEYNDDPLCGFTCTAGFYVEMMRGIKSVVNAHHLTKIPKDLPIFILSGAKDPVGSNGKDVQKAFDLYKKQGIKNISVKLYEGGRHEMLNEVNREEVYQDILHWIGKNVTL